MQKKWFKFGAIAATALVATVILVSPVVVSAADDYGLAATAGAAKIPTDKNVQTIIGNVIGTALSMISVLFFVLMLYAGIKWMLARGDSDEAKKALDTIIAAIIGMLVVLGSYAITNFVFGTLGQTSAGGGGNNLGGPSAPALPSGGGSCVVKATAAAACAGYNDLTSCTEDTASGCTWVNSACVTKGLAECMLQSAANCEGKDYCELK